MIGVPLKRGYIWVSLWDDRSEIWKGVTGMIRKARS